jgi:hypothetical protein
MAIANPAAASQPVLYCPRLIVPASFSLHFAVSYCSQFIPVTQARANLLRIRYGILLHVEIIEQLEIGVQVVILFHVLQVADSSPTLRPAK